MAAMVAQFQVGQGPSILYHGDVAGSKCQGQVPRHRPIIRESAFTLDTVIVAPPRQTIRSPHHRRPRWAHTYGLGGMDLAHNQTTILILITS